MEMRSEPPLRSHCLEEAPEGRASELAALDIRAEELFAPEEVRDVAVVCD